MARQAATWFERGGWFRLVPPGGDRGAEYWFRDMEDLRAFAEACGWMLRKEG